MESKVKTREDFDSVPHADIISEECVGHSRWSYNQEIVWKEGDYHFRTTLSLPLTKVQDCGDEDNEIVVEEVEPGIVSIRVFVKKKEV